MCLRSSWCVRVCACVYMYIRCVRVAVSVCVLHVVRMMKKARLSPFQESYLLFGVHK